MHGVNVHPIRPGSWGDSGWWVCERVEIVMLNGSESVQSKCDV